MSQKDIMCLLVGARDRHNITHEVLMPTNALPQSHPEKTSDKPMLRTRYQMSCSIQNVKVMKDKETGNCFTLKKTELPPPAMMEQQRLERLNLPPFITKTLNKRYETVAFKHCTKHNTTRYIE